MMTAIVYESSIDTSTQASPLPQSSSLSPSSPLLLMVMMMMMETVRTQSSSILSTPDRCCCLALWFIKQLLFHTQSGACGALRPPPVWTNTAPLGVWSLFHSLPLLQRRPDRFLGAVVSSPSTSLSPCQAAKGPTWWRVTFGRSDACSPLSLLNGTGNWATEEESRCLLQGMTQRGAPQWLQSQLQWKCVAY